MQVFVRFNNLRLIMPRLGVDFVIDRNPIDKVMQLHDTGEFGKNRGCVGIPRGKFELRCNRFAIVCVDDGSEGWRELFDFFFVLVAHEDRGVLV